MRKLLVCALTACLLLGMIPIVLAEQVTDAELTLNFNFGKRTGRYTGTLKDGLPDGEGTFVSFNDEQEEWTYTGAWSGGHFEGQGVTVWNDDIAWREEGNYSGDYLNGECAKYRGDVLAFRGTYENDELVHGEIYTDLGDPYYIGDFQDGFLAEDGTARAARLNAFFADAIEYDYDTIWKKYSSFIGRNVIFTGKVSEVWTEDSPSYQEFALDIDNDAKRWADVFGYLSVGEQKLALGDDNVIIFGVVLPKYEWSDASGSHAAPLIQYVATERLNFSPKRLSSGSKGEAVKALQTRLQELGFYEGEIDGGYGKGTKKSVEAFQAANGLPVDGIASLRTLYAIYLGSV